MALSLQDPPVKIPMVDQKGYPSQAWVGWFRTMFQRIGGTTALTPQELAALPALELAALTARVTTTESDIAAIQIVNTSQATSITNLQQQISNLGVGRNL